MTGGRHLPSKVNEMLVMSKNEAGKILVERIDTDRVQIAEETFPGRKFVVCYQ